MYRQTILAAAAVCFAAGCGGTPDTSTDTESPPGLISSRSALEAGAVQARAYVGEDNDLTLAGTPLLTTTDLLGGAQIDLEVVTKDSSPIRFEVWTLAVDGTATLQMPVDAESGFALESIVAPEDATWAIRFDEGQSTDVIVHMDCLGGLQGCTPFRQPGQTCPAGWSCDVGLSCELPVGACSVLDAVGTCALAPTSCAEDDGAVCGCDGNTYASACLARRVPVSIRATGACGT